MNAKRNLLPYAYIILGCFGMIASLAIWIPDINLSEHNVYALSQGIKYNLAKHDDELAEYNMRWLERETDQLKSLKWKAIISTTLFFTVYVLPGIIMIITHQKGMQAGIKTE